MAALTYAVLVEILTEHDNRFVMSVAHEVVDGNDAEKKELRHRMLHHPNIGGRKRHLPVPFDGHRAPVKARTLKAIVRRFELPADIFEGVGPTRGGSPGQKPVAE